MAKLFSREDHDAERQMSIIGSQDTVRVCIRVIQEIKAEFWVTGRLTNYDFSKQGKVRNAKAIKRQCPPHWLFTAEIL